jgi:hypothetical protein
MKTLIKLSGRATVGGIRLAVHGGQWVVRTVVAVASSAAPPRAPDTEVWTAPARPAETEVRTTAPAPRSRARRAPAAGGPQDALVVPEREPEPPRQEPEPPREEPEPEPSEETAPEPSKETEPEARDPHHVLNNPVGEPDPTEWPDPYESRPDPLDPGGDGAGDGDPQAAPHPPTGSTSTSMPHPTQDPEAIPARAPRRENLDR